MASHIHPITKHLIYIISFEKTCKMKFMGNPKRATRRIILGSISPLPAITKLTFGIAFKNLIGCFDEIFRGLSERLFVQEK
jgi:hypothetical protein